MVLYIYRSQPVCPTFLAGRYVAGELRWKSYYIRPTYPLYIEMLMLRGVGRLRVVKLALSLLGITVFIDLLLVISEPPRTQNTPQLLYFRRGAHRDVRVDSKRSADARLTLRPTRCCRGAPPRSRRLLPPDSQPGSAQYSCPGN